MGFSVRTTRGYWSLITKVKHPTLAGKEQEVIWALREPDQVRISKVDRSVYLFYRKARKHYVCVVVKNIGSKTGFIMTAYFTDKIKEGRIAWKR